MKVAFTPFEDISWTGGLHYLRNLFSALAEVPGRPLEPVLFMAPGTPERGWKMLEPFLSSPPVLVRNWQGRRGVRLARATLRGCDRASEEVFRSAGVDLVFENDTWFGARFGLPTLAWIADFQHCHLPQLFSPLQRFARTAKFNAYCKHASSVMVSSQDGRNDCESFFPTARGRVDAVPFAVDLSPAVLRAETAAILNQHNLPPKFFYFPAQLWRHKNHARLVEALALLKTRGVSVVVIATGNAADAFRPGYPAQVMQAVANQGLQENLRFLGHVPYGHIMPLMRAAAAVINPSLFEGWSTTVEEAKALGVPLVLSDLRVHREQAPPEARFFHPESAEDMARALAEAWQALEPGPRPLAEEKALADYGLRRLEFGRRFVEVAQSAVARHGQH